VTELCRRCGVKPGTERFYTPNPKQPYPALAGMQVKFSLKRTVGCDTCWAEFEDEIKTYISTYDE